MKKRFNLFSLTDDNEGRVIDMRQSFRQDTATNLERFLNCSSGEHDFISSDEWLAILSGERNLEAISNERLRKSIINGVPPELRGEIWCLLCR